MVRLKVAQPLFDFYRVHVFQFLMVRLKVNNQEDEPAQFQISIPYGAIKSRLSY